MIALTHMRWPNDNRLAEEVDEIDLILGGHDHDYTVKQVCTYHSGLKNVCMVGLTSNCLGLFEEKAKKRWVVKKKYAPHIVISGIALIQFSVAYRVV